MHTLILLRRNNNLQDQGVVLLSPFFFLFSFFFLILELRRMSFTSGSHVYLRLMFVSRTAVKALCLL